MLTSELDEELEDSGGTSCVEDALPAVKAKAATIIAT
jgi:hypothetical protein